MRVALLLSGCILYQVSVSPVSSFPRRALTRKVGTGEFDELGNTFSDSREFISPHLSSFLKDFEPVEMHVVEYRDRGPWTEYELRTMHRPLQQRQQERQLQQQARQTRLSLHSIFKNALESVKHAGHVLAQYIDTPFGPLAGPEDTLVRYQAPEVIERRQTSRVLRLTGSHTAESAFRRHSSSPGDNEEASEDLVPLIRVHLHHYGDNNAQTGIHAKNSEDNDDDETPPVDESPLHGESEYQFGSDTPENSSEDHFGAEDTDDASKTHVVFVAPTHEDDDAHDSSTTRAPEIVGHEGTSEDGNTLHEPSRGEIESSSPASVSNETAKDPRPSRTEDAEKIEGSVPTPGELKYTPDEAHQDEDKEPFPAKLVVEEVDSGDDDAAEKKSSSELMTYELKKRKKK